MLFRSTVIENVYSELEEKIKKDIVSSLQKKGVNISQVQIDLSSGSVNVSVSINQN